jgi:predicted ArsR family transcriptional regulator
VGRGCNFFLPPERKIGLCLVAPLDLRIQNTMKELGLPEKEARKHISKLEENLCIIHFLAGIG